ncbi:MAG: hypothetical protein IPM45_18190 [Acidimicrobiales bacterium]|nr:hypothetical protein [Acidimicrobiales bacterium]
MVKAAPPRLDPTAVELRLRADLARLEGELTVARAERDLAVSNAQGWQRQCDAISGALVEARRSVCTHGADMVPRAQAVALAAEVERLQRLVEVPRVTP